MQIATDDKKMWNRGMLLVLLFVGGSFGAAFAIRQFHLSGVALGAIALVWVGGYLLFIREVGRKQMAMGCASPAMLRYNRRIGVITIIYVAAIVGAVWAAKTYAPVGPVAWLIALVPAIPVLAMVWAMMRLIVEEQDEYLRARVVEQGMMATGFMLAVVTVYGFLETFDLVPHVPAYGAFIVWCAGLGVAACWQRLRPS